MDFDDILTNYIGEFGLYQVLILCCVCSAAIHPTLNDIDYTFIAATPEFWCNDVNISHLEVTNFTRGDLMKIVSPQLEDGSYDSCWKYDRDYSKLTIAEARDVLVRGSNISVTVPCRKWEYSQSQFISTAVTKFDLVCDREWMLATSQAIYMVGKFSLIFGGFISDRYGRRVVMLISLILQFVARIITSLAMTYYIFVFGRALMGVVSINMYVTSFVIGLEMVGPKWRILAGQSSFFFWSIGYMLLPGVAYIVRDWRYLTLVLLIFALPHLLYFCFLPESVRWLISKKRISDARQIIVQIAKINKTQEPDETVTDQLEENSQSQKYMDLFKSWYFIRITSILGFQWLCVAFIYFSLIYYLPKLGGNLYINTLISGALEIPALVFVQLSMDSKYFGRRIILSASFILSGLALLSLMIIPKNITWLMIMMAVLGRFAIAAAFSAIYIHTSEIYPTFIRGVGLSLCSTVSRLGTILSPYIILLANISTYIVPVLLGALAMISGILALLLPETRGQKLPESLPQVYITNGSKASNNNYIKEGHMDKVSEAEGMMMGDINVKL